MLRTKQTTRRSTKSRAEGTSGYSCTLYKDFLVFFGGLYDGEPINRVSVYNLQEERMEENQLRSKTLAFQGKFGHSACYYEQENTIIFYGGENYHGGCEDANSNPNLNLKEGTDGLSWYLTPGIEGDMMESPISHIYENKLYMYQPNEANDRFGRLSSYDLERKRWRMVDVSSGDMRLYYPSDEAMFVKNKLYILTQNIDQKPKAATVPGGQFIEDVYVLDLNTEEKVIPQWERISSSGQVPSLLCNISMAETNGIIYIFGESFNDQGKLQSVLWTYDANEEKWSQVKDIGTLTARPNQRAVVYKGQLLIIDWNYITQTIGIQYHSLNGDYGENFISQSPSGKDLCKDEDESFIQDAKSLFSRRLFPDVVFEVEGEEIPAHKALLAYRSDYFMKMFTNGVSELENAKIPISNMELHVFKAILQYVYCNEVELDEQLALDLIPVVDEYLMKGLKGLCEKYLCKQLRRENVVDMLIVADRYQIQELKKVCFKFILKNLGNIDENEDMNKLSKSLFIELLKFSTASNTEKKEEPCKKKIHIKRNSGGLFGNR